MAMQVRSTQVIERSVRPDELRLKPAAARMPLVIEAAEDESHAGLQCWLREQGPRVRQLLSTYGVLLIRGFKVETERQFEAAVSAIEGTRPMPGYFMSEPGRTPVEGSDTVFYTNKNIKTGGSFMLGGFHTENFFSADVPAMQCFWCKTAPSFGGETALTSMAHVYEDLSSECRTRLEQTPVTATRWRVADVAERYRTTPEVVEHCCTEFPLRIEDDGGERHIVLRKAPVLEHPHTGRRALHFHVREVPAADKAFQRACAPSYRGWRWLVHRFGWRVPAMSLLLSYLDHWKLMFGSPRVAWQFFLAPLRLIAVRAPKTCANGGEKLAARFSADDIEAIGASLWRHSFVIGWERGDILIVDNLQTAHTGMPGFGPRDIRVMLCNVADMRPGDTGVITPVDTRAHASLDQRLCAAAARQEAAALSMAV